MIDEDSLRERQAAILPHLDERQRRLFAAAEAKAAGYGGIAAVSRTTRIAASTIGRGLKDLARPPPGRVRRSGGGRKSLVAAHPRLLEDLNALVEPGARGDPMSSLRWTCKSLRRLAAELKKLGHQISHTVVGELLKKQKFSLQPDAEGEVLDVLVQFKRNEHAALKLMRKLLKKYGFAPDRMITDDRDAQTSRARPLAM
jgi:transposase